MKGFLLGGFWALVLGGVGLGFVSLANEEPVFAQGPAAPQIETPELSIAAPSSSVSVTVAAEAAPQLLLDAPRVADVVVDNALPDVSTAPATPPLVAKVETAFDDPVEAETVDMASEVDQTIVTSTEVEAPSAPLIAEAANIETTPPLYKIPEASTDVIVIENPSVATPQEPEVDAPLIVILEEEPAPVESLIVSGDVANAEEPEVQTEAADAIVAEVDIVEPQAPAALENDSGVANVLNDSSEESNVAASAELVEPNVDVDVETETATDAEIITVQNDDAPEQSTEVRINRLSVAAPEEEVIEETPAEPVPALEAFAAAFENPEALPVISIVMIDDGETSVSDLSDLGFRPTVVVDALTEGAQDRAAILRAAGLEVAMQIALPNGAQPSDVEITFQSAFDIIPDAALFFSDGSGVVQSNRTVTTQVMQILADEGRGFVTVQRGLGNAARTAEQEGIPAATIQRDLDGNGENERAIARGLDQAAFRARQSGGSVLLARMQQDTLSALRNWSAANDPDTLLLGPASSALIATVE